MTTNQLISCLVGLVYGAAIGIFKCTVVWHKMLHPKKNHPVNHNELLKKMVFSNFVNIASLLAIFFLRHKLPFDFEDTIIAAAISLGLTSAIYPTVRVHKHEKAVEKPSDTNDKIKTGSESKVSSTYEASEMKEPDKFR